MDKVKYATAQTVNPLPALPTNAVLVKFIVKTRSNAYLHLVGAAVVSFTAQTEKNAYLLLPDATMIMTVGTIKTKGHATSIAS